MALPKFTDRGYLPPGIWSATLEEVTLRFCEGEKVVFKTAIENISAYALKIGAKRIIFGGSFITTSQHPGDLDILLVFGLEKEIAAVAKTLEIDNVAVDIVLCSEEKQDLLSAYVTLFSRARDDTEVGVVEINLGAHPALAEIVAYTDDATLDVLRWAYFYRHVAVPKPGRKILVTIHGIKSHAEWNAAVTRYASASGWVVCPFIYGYKGVLSYLSPFERAKIVNSFRDFIYDVSEDYGENISVISHSFGTYVVGSYLSGWDIPPVKFKAIILTGSILNPNRFEDIFGTNVLQVINEMAPNDAVVKAAGYTSWLVDAIVGTSGVRGFSTHSERLSQSVCQIFDHNNVIKKDVVIKRWLPQLELYARQKLPS